MGSDTILKCCSIRCCEHGFLSVVDNSVTPLTSLRVQTLLPFQLCLCSRYEGNPHLICLNYHRNPPNAARFCKKKKKNPATCEFLLVWLDLRHAAFSTAWRKDFCLWKTKKKQGAWVVLIFMGCLLPLKKEGKMHFKGRSSRWENVIWRLAQGLDDAWRKITTSLYVQILHSTGWYFSHIEKCGETTALTLRNHTVSVSLWILMFPKASLAVLLYLLLGIYSRDNKGEVLEVGDKLLIYIQRAGGDLSPRTTAVQSAWGQRGLRSHRCCYVDPSCWCKTESARAISLRISSGIYASTSPELQQIPL